MKKEEVKKKYSDSIAKGVIDEDLIDFVVNKEIDDNDLYLTVENVEYNDKMRDSGKISFYDHMTKSLNINSSVLEKYDYNDEVDLESAYSSVLADIYKELTYARQELLFQKWNNYYSKQSRRYKASPEEIREIILIDLFRLTYEASKKRYHKYKNIFPTEHEANFYSRYKTMDFENEYNLYNKKTEDYRTLTLTKLLLEGYKYNLFRQVVSPVDRLQPTTINKSDIRDMMINLFNSYERLIYGMPVSNKTINSIATISNGVVIPKCSTFEEVEKKLLKRK